MNSMKRQKDMTPEDKPLRSEGVLYATGEELEQLQIAPGRTKQWSQSRNDAQLWMCLVVKVKSDAVKNNIALEPGMSGPWIKVLDLVKQEMARVKIGILGISEVKWTGMGEYNSDGHYIYYCG